MVDEILHRTLKIEGYKTIVGEILNMFGVIFRPPLFYILQSLVFSLIFHPQLFYILQSLMFGVVFHRSLFYILQSLMFGVEFRPPPNNKY
jgi:hypothetical protein